MKGLLDTKCITIQLEKVLSSKAFEGTPRLQQLLRYLVEQTINGQGERLKGYNIAIDVFNRQTDFDPSSDAIVRVQMGKLRQKLAHYYFTEGAENDLHILLEPGSYIPDFKQVEKNTDSSQVRGDSSEQVASCTVAVFPFQIIGQSRFDYLCTGVTDEIITLLARFTSINVVGRHGMRHSLMETDDFLALRKKFDIAYVLVGQLVSAEEAFRINTQLIDTQTNQHVWAESFSGEMSTTKLFEIQDLVADQVVARIALSYGAINRREINQAIRKPPETLSQYEWVLKAYDYVEYSDEVKHRVVRDGLEKTVKDAPQYAEAWAMLAWVYADEYRFNYNVRENSDPLDRALDSARKAVNLEPTNSIANLQLATTYYARKDIDMFHSTADKALSINNKDTYLLADLGTHLCFVGEWERGLSLVDSACQMNPFHPEWYNYPRVIYNYMEGRYNEALVRALKTDSQTFFWNAFFLVLIYRALGRIAEAESSHRDLLAGYPEFPKQAKYEIEKWILEPNLNALLYQRWNEAHDEFTT